MGDPIACCPWLPEVEHRAMVASITFDLLPAHSQISLTISVTFTSAHALGDAYRFVSVIAPRILNGQ